MIRADVIGLRRLEIVIIAALVKGLRPLIGLVGTADGAVAERRPLRFDSRIRRAGGVAGCGVRLTGVCGLMPALRLGARALMRPILRPACGGQAQGDNSG